VLGGDGFGMVEMGDRPGDFEDAVVRAGSLLRNGRSRSETTLI
jgi:hypothetical protein